MLLKCVNSVETQLNTLHSTLVCPASCYLGNSLSLEVVPRSSQ